MLSNSPLMFWRKLVFVRLHLLDAADQMAFSHTTRHANSVCNTLVVIIVPVISDLFWRIGQFWHMALSRCGNSGWTCAHNGNDVNGLKTWKIWKG